MRVLAQRRPSADDATVVGVIQNGSVTMFDRSSLPQPASVVFGTNVLVNDVQVVMMTRTACRTHLADLVGLS